MVIVRLMGGMGNQLFQYAFGLYLAKKNNTSLKLDLHFLNDNQNVDIVKREFDLSIFNITETQIATGAEIAYYSGVPLGGKDIGIITRIKRKLFKPVCLIDYSEKYNEKHKHLKGDCYLEGYFQSPEYFKEIQDEICKEYSFKEIIQSQSNDLYKMIRADNSIALNVRRADFVDEKYGKMVQGFVGLDYYYKAIEIVKQKINNPKVFIFSDDIDWCNKNLKQIDIPFCIVDHTHKGNKFGNYLHLMSVCKHFIIPNSTFAWWAAWLNQDKEKLVIAPKRWYADSSKNPDNLIPASWLRI